jgi:hypothetical protein
MTAGFGKYWLAIVLLILIDGRTLAAEPVSVWIGYSPTTTQY